MVAWQGDARLMQLPAAVCEGCHGMHAKIRPHVQTVPRARTACLQVPTSRVLCEPSSNSNTPQRSTCPPRERSH
jgi:hypothetical protein